MSERPVPGPWLTTLTKTGTPAVEEERVRLLVVDDDDRLRQAYAALFIQQGFLVEQAVGGADAVRKLANRKHHVVVLDLLMPEVGGFDVLRFMRAEGIDAKAVVVSGEVTFDAARKALRLGAFDFVPKGQGTDELVSVVGRAIEQAQTEHMRRTLHARIEQSDAVARFMLHSSPDLAYMLDPVGRFLFVNDRFVSVIGLDRAALIGRQMRDLVVEPDRAAAQFVVAERRTGARASRHAPLRLRAVRTGENGQREGAVVHVEVSASGIYTEDRRVADQFLGTLGVAHDVSDQRRVREIMRFHAYHDLLTQLPNRTLFKDRLTLGIAQATRNQSRLAVMFLDLDRFKIVNDSLGHNMGDRLLKAVATRLTNCLRKGDTLSRFGGDEFTLLLPEIRNDEDVGVIARKIVDELNAPFLIDSHELYIGASIGIAVFPEAGETAQTLIENADIAMYQIKTLRQGGFGFFSEEMTRRFSTRQSLEVELREAIEAEELEVFYQPSVVLATGRIDSVEALLRWRHPRRGLLLPAEFLPLAEETGIVARLDEWLQRTAFKTVAGWRRSGHSELRVAVNLSAQSLAKSMFVEQFYEALNDAQLAPSAVQIELTEAMLARDLDNLTPKLEGLRARGVSVTLDDFGTGLSSLSYLQRLPLDTLKIDGSFVQGVRLDDEAGMVAAIAGLARGLRLEVIAEGVESRAQLLILRRLGLLRAQGYLFAKPVEAHRMLALLDNGGFESLVSGLPPAPARVADARQ